MQALRFDQPLSADAMDRVMTDIMTGKLPPETIADFLKTLARRGETAEEIASAASVLRKHAVAVPLKSSYALCDTCGTGGDGKATINVSTLAAWVAAAAGVRIAKHGNRAASSRCGSADLLEALGVNLDATPAQVARCIEEAGFGFCFAPRFHPAMKAVAPIRKSLGIRTLFNLIGPLANPCALTFQLVGVSDPGLLKPMAEALARLGIRHGLVVHGQDGLDEVSLSAPTAVCEVKKGQITSFELNPEKLGIKPAPLELICGADAKHNAAIARQVLSGEASPAHDIVLVNAGCVIYAADCAKTIEAGVAQARQALKSGKPLQILEKVKELSHVG